MTLIRYAVAVRCDAVWIEFYEAEDSAHAEEQATDANPDCTILCVARVPDREEGM